ncbi:MAG: alcohol dehydrogenase catalytic domain-containing protein [Deltaproteobacteria bacterium]|nr:alcohol dehydrogenase catalytic domain-containing protein [Deltaproteobacteria bacterium]
MKALFFNGSNLELQERPIPENGEGESLVRVLLAGICRTDLEILKGYMNFVGIPGHEFVGEVVKSANPKLVGKRVVGEINAGCGSCDSCRHGMERHCSNRTVLGISGRDGAFAEYLTLPDSNLLEVPALVSNEKAVFVEPLAAALEILEQIHLPPASRVLIIGDGRLSFLISLVLRLTGCDFIVLAKHRNKVKLFEEIGARVALLDDLKDARGRFDFVVEASGSPSGWTLATEFVKPRGVMILKSTYHENLEFNAAILVINEITILGSRCGQFLPALRLLACDVVDPTMLISDSTSLDEYSSAFSKAQTPGVFKVLLRM